MRWSCGRNALVVAAALGLCVGETAGAHDEHLTISLSTNRVLITPGFSGAEITLFGTIEQDAATAARCAGDKPETAARCSAYNVAVTVTGPYGAYRHGSARVIFLTPTAFRTTFALRADVPTGSYGVEMRLYAEGTLLAHQNSPFEVVKAE
jgi:hypothetical protein